MSLPVPHALAPGASAGLAGTNPTARAARLAPAAGPQVPALQPWLVNLLPPPAAPGFCRSVRRGTSWSWRCLPLPVLRGFFGLMTGSTTLRAPGLQISGLCQESGSWVLSSAVTSSSCPGSRVSLHGHLLLSALPSSLGRVSLPLGALSVGTGAGGVRSSFLFMTGGGLEHMETEFGVISGLHPQRSWSQEMNRNNHGLSVLT